MRLQKATSSTIAAICATGGHDRTSQHMGWIMLGPKGPDSVSEDLADRQSGAARRLTLPGPFQPLEDDEYLGGLDIGDGALPDAKAGDFPDIRCFRKHRLKRENMTVRLIFKENQVPAQSD